MRALPHLPLDVKTLLEQALKPDHEICKHVPGVVDALMDQLHQDVPADILHVPELSDPRGVQALSQHKPKEHGVAHGISGLGGRSHSKSPLQLPAANSARLSSQSAKAPAISEPELGTAVCSPLRSRK